MPPPLAAGACTFLLHDHVLHLHHMEAGTDRHPGQPVTNANKGILPAPLPPKPSAVSPFVQRGLRKACYSYTLLSLHGTVD